MGASGERKYSNKLMCFGLVVCHVQLLSFIESLSVTTSAVNLYVPYVTIVAMYASTQ